MPATAAPLPVLPRQAAGPRPRDLCTDCGISRSGDPSRCGRACQFIHPRHAELEWRVHGRERDPSRGDELWFGPYRSMHRARLKTPAEGAQWTGITTRLGEALLERGMVDAVLATASDPENRWAPRPVIVTQAAGMAECRGMKMGFSPLLSLLDEAVERGLKRIAVIGVACQVHALRALEAELGFERVLVVGTPCSDNTSTANFLRFLALLTDRPDEVTYFEFRADFRVEMRFSDGAIEEIPFLRLPISQLPPDFIPLTCRSCFDYTNSLADVTVGYMAGEGDQWLIVRNERGREMVELIADELETAPLGSRGSRRGPVRAFKAATERAAGGLPVRRAPDLLRPLIGWAMTRFGPKGIEFAKTRVEMKHVEGILMLRRFRPRRLRRMVPDFAWTLAGEYGIEPEAGERDRVSG